MGEGLKRYVQYLKERNAKGAQQFAQDAMLRQQEQLASPAGQLGSAFAGALNQYGAGQMQGQEYLATMKKDPEMAALLKQEADAISLEEKAKYQNKIAKKKAELLAKSGPDEKVRTLDFIKTIAQGGENGGYALNAPETDIPLTEADQDKYFATLDDMASSDVNYVTGQPFTDITDSSGRTITIDEQKDAQKLEAVKLKKALLEKRAYDWRKKIPPVLAGFEPLKGEDELAFSERTKKDPFFAAYQKDRGATLDESAKQNVDVAFNTLIRNIDNPDLLSSIEKIRQFKSIVDNNSSFRNADGALIFNKVSESEDPALIELKKALKDAKKSNKVDIETAIQERQLKLKKENKLKDEAEAIRQGIGIDNLASGITLYVAADLLDYATNPGVSYKRKFAESKAKTLPGQVVPAVTALGKQIFTKKDREGIIASDVIGKVQPDVDAVTAELQAKIAKIPALAEAFSGEMAPYDYARKQIEALSSLINDPDVIRKIAGIKNPDGSPATVQDLVKRLDQYERVAKEGDRIKSGIKADVSVAPIKPSYQVERRTKDILHGIDRTDAKIQKAKEELAQLEAESRKQNALIEAEATGPVGEQKAYEALVSKGYGPGTSKYFEVMNKYAGKPKGGLQGTALTREQLAFWQGMLGSYKNMIAAGVSPAKANPIIYDTLSKSDLPPSLYKQFMGTEDVSTFNPVEEVEIKKEGRKFAQDVALEDKDFVAKNLEKAAEIRDSAAYEMSRAFIKNAKAANKGFVKNGKWYAFDSDEARSFKTQLEANYRTKLSAQYDLINGSDNTKRKTIERLNAMGGNYPAIDVAMPMPVMTKAEFKASKK